VSLQLATISRSFQLWRFFVEGLTAELKAGELQFFADLTDLNGVKALLAGKAGQATTASFCETVPRS
jgi:hypothetical protein